MSAFLKFIFIFSWNICIKRRGGTVSIWKRIGQIHQTFFVFPQSHEQKTEHIVWSVYSFIHLNLNPICIFCISKHFYNFKYFMAWIIIFASVVKKFSHFPYNFPSLFLRSCVISRNTNHRLFSTICMLYKARTKENNVNLWCDNNVMVFTLQPLTKLFYFDYHGQSIYRCIYTYYYK